MSLPIGSFPFLTEKSVGSKRQQQYIALLNKKFKHCVVVHSTLGLVAKIFYSFPKKTAFNSQRLSHPFFPSSCKWQTVRLLQPIFNCVDFNKNNMFQYQKIIFLRVKKNDNRHVVLYFIFSRKDAMQHKKVEEVLNKLNVDFLFTSFFKCISSISCKISEFKLQHFQKYAGNTFKKGCKLKLRWKNVNVHLSVA